ncbi:MAG: YraN family protein [Acidimicrobiia bacterium]
MGVGHVPQEPIRPEGADPELQGCERGRAAPRGVRSELSHNRALGARGEQLVAEWYAEHGYQVVDRNWRCRAGEIDIVARGDRSIVFCEVKTRASDRFGSPALAVGHAKQSRLRRLAAIWLTHHRARTPVRFDVACVVWGADGPSIEVIEGAF